MNVKEDAESHELVTTSSPTMLFRLLQTSAQRIFDLPRLKSAHQMAYLVGVSIHKFQDAMFDKMQDFDGRYIRMVPAAAKSNSNNNPTAAAAAEEAAESAAVAGSPARGAKAKGAEPASPTKQRIHRRHFAFAWLNNCQDLHDFTINLQDYLNQELASHLRREQAAFDLAEQQGGELRVSGGSMGRELTVDFEDIGESFVKIGSQVSGAHARARACAYGRPVGDNACCAPPTP